MATTMPPVARHQWLPTPTIGRGGSKRGNYTLQCTHCHAKVTKAQLINDEVPATCQRSVRRNPR